MSRYRHLSVAIPMMAELENVPTLLHALQRQNTHQFSLYCCVNNPEGWGSGVSEWEREVFNNNRQTIELLSSYQGKVPFDMHIIDCCTPGHGWRGKRKGVGWARKILFDTIGAHCDDDELIVSLDADTTFADDYFSLLIDVFNRHPAHVAMAVPYYHPLTGGVHDRSMLRYEIYMRHYMLNLLAHNNPYAFTALGSAMVFPWWSYRRAGGISPLQGGEDFYLMQKFVKTGNVLRSCNEFVKPQGRLSQRVPFGTGPTIAKGIDNMAVSYPLYPAEAFQAVADTYSLFSQLYDVDVETPMSLFLRSQLKTDDLWGPLRKNFKTNALFVHACQERVDGLRILQYLKTFPLRKAEDELILYCNTHGISISPNFDFATTPISDINDVRDALFDLEQKGRQQVDNSNF